MALRTPINDDGNTELFEALIARCRPKNGDIVDVDYDLDGS